jgi:hypothetical protein
MEVTFPIAVEDHDFYDGEIWVCSRDFYGTGRGVWDPDNSCWSLLEVSHWYLDERRKQALPHGGFGSIWRYFAGALKSHAENTQFQAYLERLADEAASSC